MRRFFLPEGPSTLQLRTERGHTMWHKENLLNLAEKLVPPEFDQIAWIDGDVWFQRLDWYDATEKALEQYAVVQPFDVAVFTAEDGRNNGGRRSLASAGVMDSAAYHAGFAWAARRSLWTEAGGLYDQGIIIHGDTLNAAGFMTDTLDLTWMAHESRPAHLDRLRAWCLKNGGCGAIAGNLWHEWHGSSQDRGYLEWNTLLHGLNRERDLCYRPDGLLQWTPEADENLRERVRKYFDRRREDGEWATE
jgi:hypothetical protein